MRNGGRPPFGRLQKIREEDAVYNGNAGGIVDNNGITLTRSVSDPTASASLTFATTGPWVVSLYSYSASLTSAGFEASGLFPATDWSVTTADGVTTASLSWSSLYGSSGQPIDDALVQADPSALPTDGDSYQYELGSFEVGFQYAVPGPSALLLLALGLVSSAGYAWRRQSREVGTASRLRPSLTTP